MALTSSCPHRTMPGGHRVLGEVGVGPLVDVVRQPVAPVLEELGGGPRVVDLVEVHLVRLGEPEGAQQHRPDDEHDDEPQVEPVEPPAALASAGSRSDRAGSAPRRAVPGTSRRCRAPRTSAAASRWASDGDGRVARPGADADARRRRASPTAWPAPAAGARRRRAARRRPARRRPRRTSGRPARRGPGVGPRRGRRQLVLESVARAGPELDEGPQRRPAPLTGSR